MGIDADVVLHMRLPSARANKEDPADDEKIISRLLESGKNVITTTGFLYHKAHGPLLLNRLESAWMAGNVSLR